MSRLKLQVSVRLVPRPDGVAASQGQGYVRQTTSRQQFKDVVHNVDQSWRAHFRSQGCGVESDSPSSSVMGVVGVVGEAVVAGLEEMLYIKHTPHLC